MIKIVCLYCGKEVDAQRRTKKFCSPTCAQRHAKNYPKTRKCGECGEEFQVLTRSDCNRRYCSERCAKKHNSKALRIWHKDHPEAQDRYEQTRMAKNPGAWKEKSRQDRLQIIALLGGKCIVCGVDNPNWLHVDYIPTTRGKPFRHPRHLRFIQENIDDFRLLCANHHYELTLTGTIEGTDITQ